MSDTIMMQGLSALQKILMANKGNLKPQLQKIIVKNGTQLVSKTQENMINTYIHVNPRTGKQYSNGDTRRNTRPTYTDDNLTVTVAPGTDYFPYVELGTRKMAAEPTLKPAFDSQSEQFKDDVKKLVHGS